MTRPLTSLEIGGRIRATASPQPAGGPSDLSRFASQPIGAHQAHGCAAIPPLPLVTTAVRRPDPEAWPEHVREEMNAILSGKAD